MSYSINLDVVGTCNLRCPSCPVGNWREAAGTNGFMTPETLGQILDKAMGEATIESVSLFNWAEPLLHPQLPQLVREVRRRQLRCKLSSNLNILKNPDELMTCDLSGFRISISGFTQEAYGRTHRGGNIERVKQNMIALAEAKQRHQSPTKVHVLYHLYLTNLGQEEQQMRQFTESLGFKFIPIWAFMLPLEKVLTFVGEEGPPLSDQDRDLIESLALPLDQALEAAQRHRHQRCRLREEELTIDWQGNVQLCCSVYDAKAHTIGSFLDMPLAEIQQLKRAHSTCNACMKHGIHAYYANEVPEVDQIAAEWLQFVQGLALHVS